MGGKYVLFFALVFLALFSANAESLFQEDFNNLGQWHILWGDATINNGMLTLTSTPPTNDNETFSALITAGDDSWQDYTLTVEVRTEQQLRTDPKPWEVAWLFFRYTDLENYYYFIFKPNGVELGKKQGSVHQIFLQTKDTPHLEFGRWYDLRVKVQHNHIQIFLDNEKVIDYYDLIPVEQGRIALYEEDSVAYFDEISVDSLSSGSESGSAEYPAPQPHHYEPVASQWQNIVDACVPYGLDPYYIAALVKIESWFDPRSENIPEKIAYESDYPTWFGSYYGKGLLQLTGPWIAGVPYPEEREWVYNMPPTAQAGDAPRMDDPFDPVENLQRGCWYISTLMDYYDQDIRVVTAAFHRGWQRYNDGLLDPETDQYTLQVMEYYQQYLDDVRTPPQNDSSEQGNNESTSNQSHPPGDSDIGGNNTSSNTRGFSDISTGKLLDLHQSEVAASETGFQNRDQSSSSSTSSKRKADSRQKKEIEQREFQHQQQFIQDYSPTKVLSPAPGEVVRSYVIYSSPSIIPSGGTEPLNSSPNLYFFIIIFLVSVLFTLLLLIVMILVRSGL